MEDTKKTKKNNIKRKSSKPKKKVNRKVDLELSKTQNIPITTKIITDDINDEYMVNKNKNLIIIGLVIVIAIILLIFLGNKSFFRHNYTNGKFSIDIPMFLYYKSDTDNIITFKTIRKSEKIKAYFDEYLSNLDNYDFYNCSEGIVYYNEDTKNAIYDIEVTKSFAIKTIKIKYDIKDKACE